MGRIKDGKIFLPTIGSFLKERRERMGLTQENVEAETGIKRYNIAKYEKGEVDMPVSRVPELCQLYECRMADCGSRVDSEMGYYDTTRDATKSHFMDMQYMSYSLGTPMVPADYEAVDEQEFTLLIESLIQFRNRELADMDLLEDAAKRLRHNFAFFMVEFIVKNTVNKDRRDRLLKLCNEALKEDLQDAKKNGRRKRDDDGTE